MSPEDYEQEIEKLEEENKGLASLLNRFQKEILQREEAITNYRSLVESLDRYVGILDDEIKTLIPLAHIHGWRSSLVEKGIAIRELIDRARKLLEP